MLQNKRYQANLWFFCSVLTIQIAAAHPTGNMEFNGEYLVWSYVCPIGNVDHQACLMLWDEEGGSRPWLVSEYSASDWMIAPSTDGYFILAERYFNPSADQHFLRLLKAKPPETEVEILLDWHADEHRFGEAGFVLLPDGSFLFARYPNVYQVKAGEAPQIVEAFNRFGEIGRVRDLGDGTLLLLAGETAWQVTLSGEVINQWSPLLDTSVSNIPFMGNRVWDADLSNEQLNLAYWGGRRLDLVAGKKREILYQFTGDFLPHAVASGDGYTFVLASTINPSHDVPITPMLICFSRERVVSIFE